MTTIIIDVQNCKVYSDSRGTMFNKKFSIKNFGGVVEEAYYDNTQKIFKTGNHVITGCGSLDLLNKIVGNCNKDKFNTPKSFYFYSGSDYAETTVYICKRSGGKLSGIRLYLTPKRIPLIGIVKVKVEREIIGSGCLYSIAGSGSSYAESVLRLGLSPEEALRSAIQFDRHTGGEIQEVSL